MINAVFWRYFCSNEEGLETSNFSGLPHAWITHFSDFVSIGSSNTWLSCMDRSWYGSERCFLEISRQRHVILFFWEPSALILEIHILLPFINLFSVNKETFNFVFQFGDNDLWSCLSWFLVGDFLLRIVLCFTLISSFSALFFF